ncbi:MAG: alkaline phosphatase D family protein [Bacteroidia bacterium]
MRLLGLGLSGLVAAQVVVGGVTERSARLFIWDTVAEVALGSEPPQRHYAPTPPLRLELTDLKPSTRYTYTVRLSKGDSVQGTFYTPPLQPLRVAFISCNELGPQAKRQQAIYQQIAKVQPHLIIHLGDWGYPDTTEPNFPPGTRFFPYRWENLVQLYAARYNESYIQSLLRAAAWAYLYDDHDYVADNTGKNYRAQYRTLSLPVGDYPFDPRYRQHAMEAYRQFFPHYPLPAPEEALFQSFRWGDVEFFFLDTRSARTGTMRVFELGELGRYYFRPKPEITLLGAQQREWLLDALRRSTAKWKIILSGVTYNRNLRLFIEQVLTLPNQEFRYFGGLYKVPAIFIAGFIADTWGGYPADQDSLLAWCWRHGIRGVVIVSGDTHVATMEDGTMGGFPELMTGGIGKVSKRSYLLAKKLRIGIFNRGAQGLTTKAFRPAFGLAEFYADSAHFQIIDAKGEIVGQMTCRAQDLPLPPALWDRLTASNGGLIFHLEPIGGRKYKLRWLLPRELPSQLTFRLYNAQGEKVWEAPTKPAAYWQAQKVLELPAVPSGTYFLRAESGGAYYGQRLHLP